MRRSLLVATFRPYRWRFAALIGWMGVLALATAAFGALAGPAMRALFGGEAHIWPSQLGVWLPAPRVETLRVWLGPLIVAVAVMKAVAHYRQTLGSARVGQAIVRDLRVRLHERVLRLPPDVAAALGVGDLLSRGTHDAEATERLFTEGLASLVRNGLQILALVVLCVVIDWRLTLMALLAYPMAVAPIAWFSRRLRRLARQSHDRRGELCAEIHGQLGRLPWIQLSGSEPQARANHARVTLQVEALSVRIAALRAIASPLMEVLGAAALAGTLLYAASRIDAGTLRPEHVLSFLAGLLMLYQPVKGLASAAGVIEPGRAAFDRIEAILELPDRLPEGGFAPPPTAAPLIEVRDIQVSRGNRRVLDGFSARFKPNRVTVIVGPNGVGKTTVAWALARLIEHEGTILVDGRALRSIEAATWRRAVGWVPQEPLLFSGTVRSNLIWGLENVSDVELSAVVERVGLDPGRLDAVLGDGGAGLSGGEKQALSLARALLRSPRVLVCDEPNAHLDAAHARRLNGVLSAIAREGDCTVILITHDPAVAAIADDVVELRAA